MELFLAISLIAVREGSTAEGGDSQFSWKLRLLSALELFWRKIELSSVSASTAPTQEL